MTPRHTWASVNSMHVQPSVVVKHADGQTKLVTKTGAASSGAFRGTMRGWGIRDDFRQRTQDVLKPGIAALAPFGGEVIKTSLSDEATPEIHAALDADRATVTTLAGASR